MEHLGDITKINGFDAPIVDCIIGGSPCQDLSVAGLRKGLQHADLGSEETTRSGLFMEQIRIVKEMREHDRSNGRTGQFIRPRFMVWENVEGAFSSGREKGADFAAVIEECIKVAEPNCPSVQVPKGGWTKCGCYYDAMGRWSIAWALHDAQNWCVPQRRKRISLVCDFGGLCAPEVLFERKGLSWNQVESQPQRKETPGSIGEGSGSADSA